MKDRKIPILLAALCGAVVGYFRTSANTPMLSFPMDAALLSHRPLLLISMAGWALFSLYWEAAAKNAAPAASSESRLSRGVHVFLVNVAWLLVFLPVRGLGRYLPASAFIMAAGLGVQGMGTLLAVWARRHLGRNWSGKIAINVEHQLVRSGPYLRLRHPIYTGLLVMYAGMALVTGEWLALVGVALAAFAYWRKIRLEEAALDVAFGPDYDAYRRTTWALVPGLF